MFNESTERSLHQNEVNACDTANGKRFPRSTQNFKVHHFIHFEMVHPNHDTTLTLFMKPFHDPLVDIPALLALTLLREFGNWKWFCLLDDAYCNSLRRNSFLEILSCEENVFDSLPEVPRAQFKRFIEWLVDRNVKILKLSVITAFRQLRNDKRNLFFHVTGYYLKELSFEWTIGSIDLILHLTSKYCPNLQKLAIWYCALGKSLRDILTNARQLRALRLHECCTVKASHFKNLSLLNMRSINMMDNVDYGAVRAMCAACPNLKRLQMGYNKSLQDADTMPIRQYCRHLVALNLTHCRALTDTALLTIFFACKQITELDVSGCEKLTDRTIRAFTRNCTRATKLLIQNNAHFSNDSMAMVSCAFGASLKLLFMSDCTRIDSLGLSLVISTCTSLTSLDIGINEHFNNGVLLTMLPQQCPRLTELVLSELMVTDVVLNSIADNCRDLVLLHMYAATGYSIAGVRSVVCRCSKLKELLVSLDDTVITTVVLEEVRALRTGLVIVTENYILGHGVLDGPDDA